MPWGVPHQAPSVVASHGGLTSVAIAKALGPNRGGLAARAQQPCSLCEQPFSLWRSLRIVGHLPPYNPPNNFPLIIKTLGKTSSDMRKSSLSLPGRSLTACLLCDRP